MYITIETKVQTECCFFNYDGDSLWLLVLNSIISTLYVILTAARVQQAQLLGSMPYRYPVKCVSVGLISVQRRPEYLLVLFGEVPNYR